MRKAIWLGIAAGALGLGLMAAPVAAAPIGGGALQTTEPAPLVEKVYCRWVWRYGHWHCSRRHHHARFFFRPKLWFGFGPFAFGVHRPFYHRYHYYRPAFHRFRRGCCW
jgi:hypothetical protein